MRTQSSELDLQDCLQNRFQASRILWREALENPSLYLSFDTMTKSCHRIALDTTTLLKVKF